MATITASVDELLAAVERREPFEPAARRSAAAFERVWIDGEAHIVKYLRADRDFMMRTLGVDGSHLLRAYAKGLFDVAADIIDHAVVGAAPCDADGAAFLMRDVSDCLAPPGDEVLPEAQHRGFIDHLALLCARTWGWRDDVGLAPYAARWTLGSHAFVDNERRLGDPEGAAALVGSGWEQFAQRAPGSVAEGVESLRHDLGPLVTALSATPSCFLHGDWKASNLGTAPDGRTVLIDWVYLGEGPPCHELAWYVAINRRKLPTSKEAVIADFQTALERHGVDTAGWWDRQLGLSLLGALVQFGWEKALGDDEELGWWCERAREGLGLL